MGKPLAPRESGSPFSEVGFLIRARQRTGLDVLNSSPNHDWEIADGVTIGGCAHVWAGLDNFLSTENNHLPKDTSIIFEVTCWKTSVGPSIEMSSLPGLELSKVIRSLLTNTV